MTRITLTPDELTALQQHKQVTVIEPLIEQPTENAPEPVVYDKIEQLRDVVLPFFIPLRYPVGSSIGVKEEWKYCGCVSDNYIIEFTDGIRHQFSALVYNSPFKKFKSHIGKTLPALKLPDEAIRFRLTVISNEVKRVQDVTLKHWHLLHIKGGLSYASSEQQFIDWFNTQFGKPKYNRKSGGYVCYAWDIESWLQLYNSKLDGEPYTYLSDSKWHFKKHTLTIYPNAWYEIVTLELEE